MTRKITLISQQEAALLVGGSARMISYWESRGWLAAAPNGFRPTGQRGRPCKLYDKADVIRVAASRGRTVEVTR